MKLFINVMGLFYNMVSGGKGFLNPLFLMLSLLMVFLLPGCNPEPKSIITSFSTGGHTVYHLQPGTVSKNGKRVIISAAYDGYVHCHSADGKLLWKNQPGKGFPFDLEPLWQYDHYFCRNRFITIPFFQKNDCY